MTREREPIKIIHLDDVEISFCTEDPDGDPDRAGDGWYFQMPGSDSWSGAWHSEDECREMAESDLKDHERWAYTQELYADGFSGVSGMIWPSTSEHFEVCGRIDYDMVHLVGISRDRVEVVVVDAANVSRMEVTRGEMNERRTPGFMVVSPTAPPEGSADDVFDCAVLPLGEGELVCTIPIAVEGGEFGHKFRAVRQAVELISARIEDDLAAAPRRVP